ncbi:MAG TPA: hypothetical protein VGN17_23705 [Bryobacteraceae bacterium]|jgi:hypothetical protein
MKAPFFAMVALALTSAQFVAGDTLTVSQQEEFLRTAKVMDAKPSKKGVTDTLRLTLSDGKITHDASYQSINDSKAVFQGQSGTTEFNFKDTYLFDIAAWKLARMLGLEDMVPPSVERRYKGQPGAFTWWVDDVMMDEVERVQKKLQPPDPDSWGREIQVLHVFDQLMYNTDSNATNLLIDKQWHIWMIDHSRAFRLQKTLQDPKMLSRCDRALLAKMKALDQASLQKEMKNYLTGADVKGVLARRDLIVKFFEGKGDSALFDRPERH